MARIGDFQRIAQQTGRVVVDDGGAVKTSSWRGKVASKAKGTYATENTKAKQALVKAIKNAYGNEAASAAAFKLNLANGEPLTTRDVRAALDAHVKIMRQPMPLQKGDVSFLLARAGVKGANGVNSRPEMLAQLKTDMGALKSNSALLDKIVMAPESQLRSLVASSLGLTDPKAQTVSDVVAAIRSGCPNKFLPDGNVLVEGKIYKNPVELARGANGMAVKYTADDHSTIVVKTALPSMMEGDALLAMTRKEVETHRHAAKGEGVGANHIAPLLAPIRTPDGTGVAIVLKNCELGDTSHLFRTDSSLKKAVDGGLISKQAASMVRGQMALDIMKAVHHLQHSRQMRHLDLKPGNVFMNRQGSLQLGDFGEGQTTMASRDVAGTKVYQAPELNEARFSTMQADTYSVGAMLYELYTGRRPFFDDHEQSASALRARDKWFESNPDGLASGEYATDNKVLNDLINGLTRRDPTKRLTMEEAMKSPLFDDVQHNGAERPEVRSLMQMLSGRHFLEKEQPTAPEAIKPRVDAALLKLTQEMMQTSAALGLGVGPLGEPA
jgi:serine/threonine protein kinase